MLKNIKKKKKKNKKDNKIRKLNSPIPEWIKLLSSKT
jgi:hypothetical protein